MIKWKMPKKYYKARRTIGESGAFVAVVTVSMCGLIRRHWNYRTVQMAGFGSYWTES